MREPRTRPDYRSDIDGLRAIAVLSVLIFHARDSFLPGGFVGVDVFFVISGYLISRHIAAEILAGHFSLSEFYRRRIRRIVPMMMTVLAATVLASYLLMTPEDSQAVAKSAAWSIASMANVHFWKDLDTGYFANSSAEVPLLHLWSLGVEEQFYLVWPVVLALGIRRLRPLALLVAVAAVTFGSFQLAASVFPRDASFAYYMLPTRAGELLLGALAGLPSVLTPWRASARQARLAGWLGAGLIAASLWAIDRHDAFPGWAALPPTLGAALMLLAGEHPAGRFPGLRIPPMVFIGKISYSAYLWHWPLFALYRYGYGEPSVAACAVILSATLLLAWLSFACIERPTRGSTAPLRTVALRQFALPAVALLAPCLLMVYGERIGLPTTSPAYQARLQAIRAESRPAYTFDWVCQRQRLTATDLDNPNCVLGAKDTSHATALLWGDSNAAHYIPMVRVLAEEAGGRFRNVAVGSCPPLFADPAAYVDARRLADCKASAQLVAQQISRYPVVIVSAAWSSYLERSPAFMDDVASMVRDLTSSGHEVVLIGRAPMLEGFDRRCQEKALRLPFKHCDTADQPLKAEVIDVNARLQALAVATPHVRYFDPNPYLCPAGQCGQVTAKGQPRFFDATHLTVAGSLDLGGLVLAKEGIPPAFQSLRR